MTDLPTMPVGNLSPEARAVFAIIAGVIGTVVVIGHVIAEAYEWLESKEVGT